jgi:hypothetical protein
MIAWVTGLWQQLSEMSGHFDQMSVTIPSFIYFTFSESYMVFFMKVTDHQEWVLRLGGHYLINR